MTLPKDIQALNGYLKISILTPVTPKNTYIDSDICMVDSDTAESFSELDDKLHLLIQPDSSLTG